MYCPNCGKENEDKVQVCVACGKSLSEQTQPIQGAQQPANVDANSPIFPNTNQTKNNEFPIELKGFNWGAFLLTWIWGIGHGVWIALLVFLFHFMPFIGAVVSFICQPFLGENGANFVSGIFVILGVLSELGFGLWLGFRGNRLAWKTGKYSNIEQFKSKERKWAIAGLIVFLSIFFLVFIITLTAGSWDSGKNKSYESQNKETAAKIRSKLEDYYKNNSETYCGRVNESQNKCGTYSFKGAIEELKIESINTTDNCKEKYAGGGDVIVDEHWYTVIPYDGECKRPIGEDLRNTY